LGLGQANYNRAIHLVASYCGSTAVMLSAHQSIGVPQPVKLFGTEEQKQRYLTLCARGAISAFALTEPDVGSDPARLATTATATDDGEHVLITGSKLWITNGLIADLMVVMARDAATSKIDAYVVEMDRPGITLGHHCRFMGLKALANGVIRFDGVQVPVANRIGAPGQGLKVALVTLNTGRLSLPAACVGASRRCVEWARDFAAERVQWGAPVGQHEAIAHKLADLAATTYAMESWSRLAADLSMREGYDIRLEAAAAKEWASTRNWQIIDDAVQIRGGRGYENERSLAARGEKPFPLERMMRDSRINRIFEGSSEIMHLFMAREMVDQHLQVAGKMLERDATLSERLGALPAMAAFYARWYPGLWWGLPTFFRYGEYGRLGEHLRYAERASRRLAREVFHGMVRYQAGLEKKQAWLFRTVDIAMEIAVLCATVVRAHGRLVAHDPVAARAIELADLHGHNARRVIEDRFRALWDNDDVRRYGVGRDVLAGHHAWMESPWADITEVAGAPDEAS
ncbi:MAG: acyl-CoA dehydrogenase family protein, partial [Myxococcales bacterium]|nr:acyl-CoA dehydrogenase family protein [Myxococcales bacterium]